MNTQKSFRFPSTAHEYRIKAVRECPLPATLAECSHPQQVADYWRTSVSTHPFYSPDQECFVVIFVNTRRRINGHQLVTIGTLDTCLVHPREVFRLAIIANSAAIILAHNHPSGESSPSEADIKLTRDLCRAGQLLRIEVLDHVIVGNGQHFSLRASGFFQ